MQEKNVVAQVIHGAGWFLVGVAWIAVPSLWALLFFLSTKVIGENPVALWYTTIWLLLGSSWLLFSPKADAEKRRVVEVTVWLASVSLFIAAGFPQLASGKA